VTAPSGTPSTSREIAFAIRLLMQAGREMQTAMAHRLAVGETDLAAMDALTSSPAPMGPVELSHRLRISSASATALVDRLESAGHVRRDNHPSDRRRITLHASESARTEVRATLAPLLNSLARITERLDPDESRTVLTFLDDVAGAMREFADVTSSAARAARRSEAPVADRGGEG
jgi:DNA-binding MarR family transcriptional regulator